MTHPRLELGGYMNQHDEDARRRDQRAKLPKIGDRAVVRLVE